MLEKLKGKLIVLEGIDGSGTTSVGRRLHSWIAENGPRSEFTAEPSSNDIGLLIRRILKSDRSWNNPETDSSFKAMMAMLFSADRIDHCHKDVIPRLERGEVVVMDRYILSTFAYQLGGEWGESPSPNWLARLANDVPKPDLTIYFNVPADQAMGRVKKRGDDAEIYENLKFQKVVERNYRIAIDFIGHTHNTEVIDATVPEDEVLEQAKDKVKRYASTL